MEYKILYQNHNYIYTDDDDDDDRKFYINK